MPAAAARLLTEGRKVLENWESRQMGAAEAAGGRVPARPGQVAGEERFAELGVVEQRFEPRTQLSAQAIGGVRQNPRLRERHEHGIVGLAEPRERIVPDR